MNKAQYRFYFSLAAIVFGFGAIAYAMESNPFGIRINRSASLPYSLFLSKTLKEPSRGTFVSFVHPNYNQKIAKQIVGLPGDSIEIDDSKIYINHICYGYIKDKSPSGIALMPLSNQTIPAGFVYVYATADDSFDSRYAEFGLVRIEWLKEALCPLF